MIHYHIIFTQDCRDDITKSEFKKSECFALNFGTLDIKESMSLDNVLKICNPELTIFPLTKDDLISGSVYHTKKVDRNKMIEFFNTRAYMVYKVFTD